MIRWYHVFGGAVGLTAAGGAWLFADSVVLAGVVGVVWGAAVAVTGHGHATRAAPGVQVASFGESWTFARWIVLCLVLVYGATYVVGNVLPLPLGLSFALGLLTFGLGALGFATGYICALDEWRVKSGAGVDD